MSREAKKADLTIDNVTWKYLGSGNYNDAYVATIDGKKWVLKIAKAKDDPNKYFPALAAMDTAERSVRLWNLINPDFPAKQHKKGWVVPFIESKLDPITHHEIVPTAEEINHVHIPFITDQRFRFKPISDSVPNRSAIVF